MSLRKKPNQMLWQTLALSFCALVFFFALHAKTAMYNGGTSTRVTPSTASKLWLSGQKIEVPPVDSGTAMVFWLAVVCLFGLYLQREPRVQNVVLHPPANDLSRWHIHRFLRPPPSQS